MSQIRTLVFAFAFVLSATPFCARQSPLSDSPHSIEPATTACARPPEGAVVPEPEDLRSVNGVLQVELAFRSYLDAAGNARYCYVAADGGVSPNLRLRPGDTLILRLKNEASSASVPSSAAAGSAPTMHSTHATPRATPHQDPCSGGPMLPSVTNLHFHGLIIPAACHADETLKTLIEPNDPAFEYRFRIPDDQPPGMYWYHPHVHGVSKTQILGGASAALIVEGIEQVDPQLAGLQERVFVVRDENLAHPDAEPPQLSTATQFLRKDPEGDAMNMGTGQGKPAKDLSINYVPVPYPQYPPAVIPMRPRQRELWRVANASAITYLNLQLLFNSAPQPLEIVALDGAPLSEGAAHNQASARVSHIVVPPGGRVEFVVNGPAAGVDASLVTRGVDTGPLGENNPRRALAILKISPDAPMPRSALATKPAPIAPRRLRWLGSVPPAQQRKLYFSEKAENPTDPNSPTTFFVTVEGQTPKPFDPGSTKPSMIAQQGTVEEWTIENRSQEFHAFHIHGIHFLMTEWNGRKVDEPFLRDTINIEYWDGKSPTYPSVKLRMDFRDPQVAGILPYHCHLLEHQDGGMMGLLLVEKKAKQSSPSSAQVFVNGTP
jgi:FtsP/CotA-like multicopper oxidase with cupredoxin domain